MLYSPYYRYQYIILYILQAYYYWIVTANQQHTFNVSILLAYYLLFSQSAVFTSEALCADASASYSIESACFAFCYAVALSIFEIYILYLVVASHAHLLTK